ncbi:MAG: acetyltransferase [Saccharospirillaceae bacterium]|nr:acetyltransferase [Pseudomonadales bacterium]NRB78907.1 acetyltransferase [Saccharospirillaceae bacterium]
MFLKNRLNGHMIEIVNVEQLFSLYDSTVTGIDQVGEEAQDPEKYAKADLIFLSDEELPICWVNPEYRHLQPKTLIEQALNL